MSGIVTGIINGNVMPFTKEGKAYLGPYSDIDDGSVARRWGALFAIGAGGRGRPMTYEDYQLRSGS